MKAAGIITFHCAHNVGAVLQTYALYSVLQERIPTEVIDYYPQYHRVANHLLRNPLRPLFIHGISKKGVRGFGHCLKLNVLFFAKRKSIVAYQRFFSENIKTTRCYESFEQLKKNPPVLDICFAGSDQIWNADLTGKKFDGAYFLEFLDCRVKKVSYAASVGRDLTENELKELSRKLKVFDRIAVREDSLAEKLSEVVEKSIEVTLDPTFLLEKEKWTKLIREKAPIRGKYILVYGLEKNEELKQYVKQQAKIQRKKIVDISPIDMGIRAGKREYFVSPIDFLNYIFYADCVVTNSFHGTVFSLTWNKKVLAFAHSKRGSRVRDLLYKLDLMNIFVPYGSFPKERKAEIPYDEVNVRLVQLRQESLNYIERVLQEN